MRAATRCRVEPEDFPLEIWEDVLRTNLTGYFLYARAAGKRMIAQGHGGSIVNVSSIASASSLGRGNLAYGTSKSGVNQLTRELAVEWAHHGIRVNGIQPCQFLNEGWRTMVADPSKSALVAARAVRHPDRPHGRAARDRRAVLFLVSDAASMVTGVLLPVDGGNLALNPTGSLAGTRLTRHLERKDRTMADSTWTWDDALRGVIPPMISPLTESAQVDEAPSAAWPTTSWPAAARGCSSLGGTGEGAWLSTRAARGASSTATRAGGRAAGRRCWSA